MANITKINLQGVEYNLTDKEAQNKILELKENTYNKIEVDSLVNAIDDKIDGIDLTPYETIEGAESKYQPKGNYLTEHQDISGKADKSDTYTKAEVDAAVAGVDVSEQLKDYAKKTDIPAPYDDTALKGRVSTLEAIDHSLYLTKVDAENTYLTAESMDQALYDDAGDPSTTFGSIVSDVNDLKDNTYTKAETDEKYQAKGDYLTEHQDISGKVDKVDGKGLSTNDYTDADKAKVDATPTFWVGTQAEYDAITVKDNKTFYYITEE